MFGTSKISKIQFLELGFFQNDIQSLVQNCLKSDLSETVGIDSGGSEEHFDALVGLFRQIFHDFDQNTHSGTPCFSLGA